MTAEVAIANAGAIALAADSAVTIGDEKIYNSALKLFTLSKVAPVGIMIYGSASLLGTPWETLIKTYRESLGSDKYDHLADYATSFLKFLNTHTSAFPKSAQTRWVRTNTYAYFGMLRDRLLEETKPTIEAHGEIKDIEVTKIFRKIVLKKHQHLTALDFAIGFRKTDISKAKKEYSDIFKEIQGKVFENVKISAATETKLQEIAAMLQIKSIFSQRISGVVVAGYGEEDLYPRICTYEIEGVVLNKIKYRKNEDKCHSINGGMECRIIAFAQEDMVNTFIQGIDPSVDQVLHGFLSRAFDRLPDLLPDQTAKEKKAYTENIDNLKKEFFTSFYDYINEENAQPVLRMVTVLPKDELAAMAEALVSLTAFKRRISESVETVGGPIDVAVISKGDGLVWVKRKHYFPPELNQHFFRNYFRSVSE